MSCCTLIFYSVYIDSGYPSDYYSQYSVKINSFIHSFIHSFIYVYIQVMYMSFIRQHKVANGDTVGVQYLISIYR